MGKGICIIPECDNELAEHARSQVCPTCRASIGMWKRRGVRAVLERRSRLKKYDSRMETLVAPKAGNKVVVLTQRRKQA